GPIGADCRNIRDSASTKAAALRWETATPLGLPVEPEVKMTQASSSGAGDSGATGASAAAGASADASDVLEAPAVAGPIGAGCGNTGASASTKAAARRWETAAPLGRPEEPEVTMPQAPSSGEGASGATGASAAPGASADASDVLEAPAVAGPNPPGDE